VCPRAVDTVSSSPLPAPFNHPTGRPQIVSVTPSAAEEIGYVLWRDATYASAYVSLRQLTSAYVTPSAAEEMGYVLWRDVTDTSAYVSIRQHTSAYVSIHQHT
jgi:hypothetical protein